MQNFLVKSTRETIRRSYFGHNSVFQTPAINSWSDLKGKNVEVGVGFKILSNRFQKRKPSKKP